MARVLDRTSLLATLVALVLTLPCSRAIAQETRPATGFEVSAEEQAWLEAHPTIRLGAMADWPPLDFAVAGKPLGVGADYVAALNQRLGGRLTIVPGAFAHNLDKVNSGQLDGLLDVTPRPERKAHLVFTRPYITIPHVIIAQGDTPRLESEVQLQHKSVALEHGFFNVNYFRASHPEVIIKEYVSTSKALDAVSRGEADAYVGNRAVAMYLIEAELLANLGVHGTSSKPPVELAIGTRKDNALLAGLLDRALASIQPEEIRKIHRRWLELPTGTRGELILTADEQAWFKANPVVRVGYDVDWPPVERLDENGQLVGMSADYLRLVEQQLPVRFELAPRQNWKEMLAAGKAGDILLFSALTRTRPRAEYLDFTSPHLSFPMVIITLDDVAYVSNMIELEGRSVAVVEGYASADMLSAHHPKIELRPVANVREGVMAVVDGNAYAFVGNLPAATGVIAREGLTGVKVSGETPYRYDLSIGVRKGNPQLLSALQKALAAIDEQERSGIYRKWVNVEYTHGTDYGLLVKIVAAAALLLLVFTFWNRRLSAEVDRRVQTEKALQVAKEQAEAADQLKSAFLATMSHELRTPLNSIIGFTGILRQELAGPLSDEQHKQLTMVGNAGRHLLRLINDVLDISKIEAGQLELSCEPFDLDETVASAIRTLSPLAARKQLDLRVACEGPLGSLVSDQQRVEQILLNLVGNAIKFTDEGKVTVSCHREEGRVRVLVSDTGIGILPEDVEKLFEAFRQLDSGLGRRREGTGLGLAICRKLVTMLGGELGVESELGEGSTFWFSLPVEPADAEPRAGSTPPPPSSS